MANNNGRGKDRGGKTVAWGPGRIIGSGEPISAPSYSTYPYPPVPAGPWHGRGNGRGRGAGHVLGSGNASTRVVSIPYNAPAPSGPWRGRGNGRGRGANYVLGSGDAASPAVSTNHDAPASSSPARGQGQNRGRGRGRGGSRGGVRGRGRGGRFQGQDTYTKGKGDSSQGSGENACGRFQPTQEQITVQQSEGPSENVTPAPKTEPENLTPWLKYEFSNPGENLLMKLPGELRNRIYDMIFIKGNVRIGWLSRGRQLTYELQQKNGKWKGPIKADKMSKIWAAVRRFDRNPLHHYRIIDEDNPASRYDQAGGIAALMVCCKPIYLETVTLFYSSFRYEFGNTNTMRLFLDRLSYHTMAGIHTISLHHETYGVPHQTNFVGFKSLHDDFFLNFCNHVAHALVNLRSFSISMQINEQAPLQLNLTAPWILPLLAFAHRNLQHAEVKFLTAGKQGHNNRRLKAFAGVVKRELLGDWSKLPRNATADEILDEALEHPPANSVKRERIYTKHKKDEDLDEVKACWDSSGFIVGDDKPRSLRKIKPSFGDDDDYVRDAQPPVKDKADYAFTSSAVPRFATA